MKIAIYSRKSKLSEVGDSVENQIQLCKDYAKLHFNSDGELDIVIYEDDGYSGGNMTRPNFQRLLRDIKAKKFDVLMCYRLDRISRNVSDFSSILELLNKNNVDFVSLRESFDTSSPMGRAMVHISSVFAQLERETIAERIRDNLLSLAKNGRYIGGSAPPEGYRKVNVNYTDKNGHNKKYNILEINDDEIDKVKLIFDKYLALQSMKGVEMYLFNNDIRTRNGFNYKCVSVRRILTHPIYVIADLEAFDYFTKVGSVIADDKSRFDGVHGIIAFRRTVSQKNTDDPSTWIISVGEHEGIISFKQWIKIQQIIDSRKGLTMRRPIGVRGILSGILKCGNCGNYMRPISANKETGRFYYVCVTKEMSKGVKCKIKNIRGDKLDEEIISTISSFAINSPEFILKLKSSREKTKVEKSNTSSEIISIKKAIDKNKKAINNLLNKLSSSDNNSIDEYISVKINELDLEIREQKARILQLEETKEEIEIKEINFSFLEESLLKFQNNNSMDFSERRNNLKNIIKKAEWNGTELNITYCDV